jgi:hypothetical protein
MEDIFQHPIVVQNVRLILRKKFLQADAVKVCDELFVSVSTGRHQRLVVSMLVSTFFPDGLLDEN